MQAASQQYRQAMVEQTKRSESPASTSSSSSSLSPSSLSAAAVVPVESPPLPASTAESVAALDVTPVRPEALSPPSSSSFSSEMLSSISSSSSNHPARKLAPCRCGQPMEKPQRCSRCRSVSYCSSQCQRKDWHWHKRDCTRHKTRTRRMNALRARLSTPAPYRSNAPLSQTCFTEGLRLVFSYLRPLDLIPAVTTCRHWALVLCRESNRGLTMSLCDGATVLPLAGAPLLNRHYIKARSPPRHCCTLEDLHCLAPFLSLRQLDFCVDSKFPVSVSQLHKNEPPALPLQLEEVQLRIERPHESAVFLPEFINTHLAPLTSIKRLEIHAAGHSPIRVKDFSSSLALCGSSLEHLTASGVAAPSLHAVPSSLPLLKTFHPPSKTIAEGLLWSIEPAGCRNLTSIPLWPAYLRASDLRSLARLPALTDLRPRGMTLDAVRILPEVTNLKKLLLDVQHLPKPCSVENVIAYVVQCRKLASLKLCCMIFTLEELGCLLASLPSLQELLLFQPFLKQRVKKINGVSIPMETVGQMRKEHLKELQVAFPQVKIQFSLRKSPNEQLRSQRKKN